jgi:hypothetical protein
MAVVRHFEVMLEQTLNCFMQNSVILCKTYVCKLLVLLLFNLM